MNSPSSEQWKWHLHALRQEDWGGGRGYAGLLSALQRSMKGGCPYIFVSNWMFLVCANRNLGFLPMLAIRFFSEGSQRVCIDKECLCGNYIIYDKVNLANAR